MVKKIDIHLKGGTHIGKVLFGILETHSRKQVTVIGREVNFASRLIEEMAERDEIIVSEDLKNVVGNRFHLTKVNVEKRKRDGNTNKIICGSYMFSNYKEN